MFYFIQFMRNSVSFKLLFRIDFNIIIILIIIDGSSSIYRIKFNL